jgi:tRNA A-37 threonylcarbamoyl transferase component Bud32
MIQVGQTVGNYTVTGKLGEGGMGTVFLAEHPIIRSKVAVKAVHTHLSHNAEVVSRFVTEARAVNKIEHDHIVSITDFGTTPAGDFYLIMEYLQGCLLAEQIGRQEAFPVDRALHIAAQIADALQASHEQGVIHRDLKPDNILLINRDGTPDFVKVFDFGLAKLMAKDGFPPAHHTDGGMVMGTPSYMSPEQCEGRTLDCRSDVYSLGVILFEMLTGRLPFSGEGYGEVLTKHVSVEAPPVGRFVPDIPAGVEAIVKRALAKDPSRRFQSMSELRRAMLDCARSSMPAAEPIVGSPSILRHAAGELMTEHDFRPRRSWGRVAALAIVALAPLAAAHGALRREAGHLLATATVPARHATVRVNFNSAPSGALVFGGDGALLGTTPLSAEIPYGDAPVEYQVRKDGYTSKTASFVPNLSLPVFAVLEPIAAPSPPPVEPAPASRVSARQTVATVKPPRQNRPPRPDPRPPEAPADADEVMAPTTW